ncbi:MAG: hypothetical protein ABRQ26_13185 [Syntrophomonadaceae bacterium]|jgi:hypothetical protein
MANPTMIKFYVTRKTRDKLQSVCDKYGISASALSNYLVIRFLSEQNKPDNLDDLIINIKPVELWQVFDGEMN